MALKDQFVHARVAGIMAFMATAECFEVDDVAGRVVPAVVGATLDKEKCVLRCYWISVDDFRFG